VKGGAEEEGIQKENSIRCEMSPCPCAEKRYRETEEKTKVRGPKPPGSAFTTRLAMKKVFGRGNVGLDPKKKGKRNRGNRRLRTYRWDQ